MQKAFDLIKEKLEELKKEKELGISKVIVKEAIEIINEVAEEYISDTNASRTAWETIYRRLLEVIDEYAAVADIVNVKDCKKLSNLLRHYKEQLTEEADSTCSGGWILCSKRLPKENDYPEQHYRVLASCTDGIVRNATIKSLIENKGAIDMESHFSM